MVAPLFWLEVLLVFVGCATFVSSVELLNFEAHHVEDELLAIDPFERNMNLSTWTQRSIYRGIECFNHDVPAVWSPSDACMAAILPAASFSSFSPKANLEISGAFTLFGGNDQQFLFTISDTSCSLSTCPSFLEIYQTSAGTLAAALRMRVLHPDGTLRPSLAHFSVSATVNESTNSTLMEFQGEFRLSDSGAFYYVTIYSEEFENVYVWSRAIEIDWPTTPQRVVFGAPEGFKTSNFVVHHFGIRDATMQPLPTMELRPPTLRPASINLEQLYGTTLNMLEHFVHPTPVSLQIVNVSSDFFECVGISWVANETNISLRDKLTSTNAVDIPPQLIIDGRETLFPCQDSYFTYRASLVEQSSIYSEQRFTIHTANFVTPIINETTSVVTTAGYFAVNLQQIAGEVSLPIATITVISLPLEGNLYVLSNGAYNRIGSVPKQVPAVGVLFYQYDYGMRVVNELPSPVSFPMHDSFTFQLTNTADRTSLVGVHQFSVFSPLPIPSATNLVARQATKTRYVLPLLRSEFPSNRIGIVVTELPSFGKLYNKDSIITTVPYVLYNTEFDYESLPDVWNVPGSVADSFQYYLFGTDLLVTSASSYSAYIEVHRINQLPQLSFELPQQLLVGEKKNLSVIVIDPDWDLPSHNSTYSVIVSSNTNRLQLDASFLTRVSTASSITSIDKPIRPAEVQIATSTSIAFVTYGTDLQFYMNVIMLLGIAAASATLSISISEQDTFAWSDFSPTVSEQITWSIVPERKSANSLFLDSALMMAIIIGVPCLLVLIAVILCIRKRCRSIDNKKREREMRREEIEKEIQELQQQIKEQSFKASQSFQSLEGLAFGFSTDPPLPTVSENEMITMLAHRSKTLQTILESHEKPDLPRSPDKLEAGMPDAVAETACGKEDSDVVVYPPLGNLT